MKISHLFFIIIVLGTALNAQNLPTNTSVVFSGSGNCATCHLVGPTNPSALIDSHGNDVSPVTLWRSAMMANAAKDPFWQAKVAAEVTENPHLQTIIEDKCSTCHAPLGRTEAIFNEAEAYTITEMLADPLAMDGVSCTACHQIKSENLGTNERFNGHYLIENDRIIYGPFQDPLTMPMINSVNYTPVLGEHTTQSEMCATCHTLFTPYVDNEGNIAGEAPEQTPYLEWKNSIYPQQEIECQTCHMPVLEEGVIISNRPSSLSSRLPYANHYFVGGNIYMLKILKANAFGIGVTAGSVEIDSTIARTKRLLQKQTADLDVFFNWLSDDTLQVKLTVINKSGHKFPTAYPSRRAWLYLAVLDEGAAIWESGAWDEDQSEIKGLDDPYEVHHDIIRNSLQSQVYQSVMKDVDENVNYTLLRASGYIKDNRIPPKGFTNDGQYYDSTSVIGFAENDPNFNPSGSGTDTVTYLIGSLDRNKPYSLEAKIYYQSLAPRFVEDLRQYDNPEVTTFMGYYDAIPNLPVTIDSLRLSVGTTVIDDKKNKIPVSYLTVKTYPNPFNPNVQFDIQTDKSGKLNIEIYNILGERVYVFEKREVNKNLIHINWNAQSETGTSIPGGEYFLKVIFVDGITKEKIITGKKILYLK